MQHSFAVSDDSGFLAVADPDAYSGYVSNQWHFDDLKSHFASQMREQHLLVWSTGAEGTWTVSVSSSPSARAGRRHVVGSIRASRGRLLLTNYESLSMAAQFNDITLPEAHQTDLLFSVPESLYHCRIVQLSVSDSDPAPHFLVELTPSESPVPSWSGIAWL